VRTDKFCDASFLLSDLRATSAGTEARMIRDDLSGFILNSEIV